MPECPICGHRHLTCVCLECPGGFCSPKPAPSVLPALSPLHDTYRTRTGGSRAFRNTLKAGPHR